MSQVDTGATYYAQAFWPEQISDRIAEQLSADPWGLFKSPPRRLYFDVPAGAATVQTDGTIRWSLVSSVQAAQALRIGRGREVGEQLTSTWAHVELPPRLVENEARGMLAQQVEQIRRNGQNPGQVPADAHQQFLEPARRRVLAGLLVGEVARRHDLRLDPKRLNETLRLIASTYEEPEQVVEMYRNDPQLMQGLQNRVMEEQVIDWIAERAQHTEVPLSFQDAIRG